MAAQRLADLKGALHWCLRRGEENQRHAVTCGQTSQFTFGFSNSKLLRAAHNFIELQLRLLLLVDEQLRIADHVHKQDVRDLHVRAGCHLQGHGEYLLKTRYSALKFSK